MIKKGIKISMPFYHIDNKNNEVRIDSDEFIYSEINGAGYGLQVNDENIRKDIQKLCFQISEKVKELNELVK